MNTSNLDITKKSSVNQRNKERITYLMIKQKIKLLWNKAQMDAFNSNNYIIIKFFKKYTYFLNLILKDNDINSYRTQLKTSFILNSKLTISLLFILIFVGVEASSILFKEIYNQRAASKYFKKLNIQFNNFQYIGYINHLTYKSVPSFLNKEQRIISELFFPKKYGAFSNKKIWDELNCYKINKFNEYITIDPLWLFSNKKKYNLINKKKLNSLSNKTTKIILYESENEEEVNDKNSKENKSLLMDEKSISSSNNIKVKRFDLLIDSEKKDRQLLKVSFQKDDNFSFINNKIFGYYYQQLNNYLNIKKEIILAIEKLIFYSIKKKKVNLWVKNEAPLEYQGQPLKLINNRSLKASYLINKLTDRSNEKIAVTSKQNKFYFKKSPLEAQRFKNKKKFFIASFWQRFRSFLKETPYYFDYTNRIFSKKKFELLSLNKKKISPKDQTQNQEGYSIYLDKSHDIIPFEQINLNNPLGTKGVIYNIKSNNKKYYNLFNYRSRPFVIHAGIKKYLRRKKKNSYFRRRKINNISSNTLLKLKKSYTQNLKMPVFLNPNQWGFYYSKSLKKNIKNRELISPLVNLPIAHQREYLYNSKYLPFVFTNLENYNVYLPNLNKNLQNKVNSDILLKSYTYLPKSVKNKKKYTSVFFNLLKQKIILPDKLINYYQDGNYLKFYFFVSWFLLIELFSILAFMQIFISIFYILRKSIGEIIIELMHEVSGHLNNVTEDLKSWLPEYFFKEPFEWQFFEASTKSFENFAEKENLKRFFDPYILALQYTKSNLRLPFFNIKLDINILQKPIKSYKKFKSIVLSNNEKEELLIKPILLVGPPGTGKTLLVRAIAGEADIPVIQFIVNKDSPGFTRELVPEYEKLSKAFEYAKSIAPCILFFDEMDSLAPKRGGGYFGENAWAEIRLNNNILPYEFSPLKAPEPQKNKMDKFKTKKVKPRGTLLQLLYECNNLSNEKPILLIGATNRQNEIDPAVIRPGRFSTIYNFSLPNSSERIDFCKFYAAGLSMDKEIPWDYIAKRTVGFSPSDISMLMKESSLYGVLNNTKHTLKSLEHGIDRVLGVSKSYLSTLNISKKNVYNKILHMAYYKVGLTLLPLLFKQEMPAFIKLWPMQERAIVKQNKLEENIHSSEWDTLATLEQKLILRYGGKAAELLFSYLDKDLSDEGFSELSAGQLFITFLVDYYNHYSRSEPLGIIPTLLKKRSSTFWHNYEYNLFEFKNIINGPSNVYKEPLIGFYGIEGAESFYDQKDKAKDILDIKDKHAQSLNSYLWWYQYVPKDIFKIWTTSLKNQKWSRFWLPDPELSFFNLDFVNAEIYVSELIDTLLPTWKFNNQGLRKLNKKTRTVWPQIKFATHEYIVSCLILSSLNKAMEVLDEHREFLDFCVAHLIKEEILREPDILKNLKRFNLEKYHPKNNLEKDQFKDNKKLNILNKYTIVSRSGGLNSRRPFPLWIDVDTITKNN
uniref:ATP-dependent zinc metalloprotease FtsH homolog n=1 Tax=Helicosporidium sp. subsp. Simulium jonesii TaxID=145475 RepID=FTSHL_HELSJ|nr:cell division protein [Helicosporidium sp. ex Simulium jonesi]Q2EEX7.1 RecName: Full=ATP-dependent zinc metalloprotease FtsH homolog [Helicosporidium sp. ex Simulium jonesi]ABD33966.1 ftsH protease [Helicosporidium sp. ex Simulium jonesi]